jgi:hypothetical protein
VVDTRSELADQDGRSVRRGDGFGDDAAVRIGEGQAALAAVAGDRDAVLDTAQQGHPAVQPAVVDEVERGDEE